MSTVTLLGSRLVEEGAQFVYNGEAPGCEGCPYRNQCLNLTAGVKYEVTSVRDGAQTLECAVHDEGVRAVEVEPATVVANVPSANAYAGSKTQLAGECPYTECPSHEYCEPDGASLDEEYRIKRTKGDPPHEFCYLDRDLTMVEFESPDE